MPVRVFLACLLLFGGLTASILFSSPLGVFFDLLSALFILGVALSAALLSAPVASLRIAVSDWSRGEPLSPERALQHSALFQRLAHVIMASGLLGSLLGLVLMLQNMDDPQHIGPAMAVDLLTLLYGLLGWTLLRAMSRQCLQRGGYPPPDRPQEGLLSLGVLLIGCFMMLLSFFIMLFSFADWGSGADYEEASLSQPAPSSLLPTGSEPS